MKNLAFHGTETCKGSPLLREAGRMPALGCQLQVHCSAHLCLSSLQEVPNAWGLVNTRKVAVTSALRMGLPWAEQAPEMLASPCISLPQLIFSLLVVETWLQPRQFVTAVQSSFEAAKGGLPRWLSDKESACQGRRHKRGGFDPQVSKIPWSRKWQPTPVILPGKFHGQRSLADYIQSMESQSVDTTQRLSANLSDAFLHYITRWRPKNLFPYNGLEKKQSSNSNSSQSKRDKVSAVSSQFLFYLSVISPKMHRCFSLSLGIHSKF